MAETPAAKVTRTTQIVNKLQKAYPDARCELNYSNPLELLVATILSARCADKQVNTVTASLFQKYKTAADYAQANLEALEQELKTLGLYRNKAKSIQAACQRIQEQHAGSVPATMNELTALEGVGRKTANVVLGNAFQVNAGIAVDTHVARVAQRLRLTAQSNPDDIEKDLLPLVPQEKWAIFSHLLIWHGRRRCHARNPDCRNCEIQKACPTWRKAQ